MCESQCYGQVGSSLSSSFLANKTKGNTDSCSLSGKPSSNLMYSSNSHTEFLVVRACSLIASLTVNGIMSCTVSRIPNVALSVFINVNGAISLERFAYDLYLMLEALMLVPRLVLTPPNKRGGRAGCQEICFKIFWSIVGKNFAVERS